MADPIEVAKDVSIAFLSASALLLTLILGFISPMHTLSGVVRTDILVATLALYVSAAFSASSLWKLIVYPPENSNGLPISKVLYTIMWAAFLFGLAFIAAAIQFTVATF